MSIFNIPYNKAILIDENKNTKQKVLFEKTRFNDANTDQYFVKIFQTTSNGNYLCQGYIYFYIDFINKNSNFIGLYTNPIFRNQGIAQLLIAYWVKLCLESGIYNLNTIKKQRKPFILYLLKKFQFDLLNIHEYELSPNTISICQTPFTTNKCLYFKNPKQAETFKNGKIHAGDNYFILESLSNDIVILDQVILSKPYESKEDEIAYTRSLKLIKDSKKN